MRFGIFDETIESHEIEGGLLRLEGNINSVLMDGEGHITCIWRGLDGFSSPSKIIPLGMVEWIYMAGLCDFMTDMRARWRIRSCARRVYAAPNFIPRASMYCNAA